MKESRAFELRVGAFIFVGLVVLFVIIFSIGDIGLFERGYTIKVTFGFANGLAESAPVRLAGVDVGEIHDIEIVRDQKTKKTRVELTAWIEKGVKIEEDSLAIINTLGLLGEKYLEVFPGTVGGEVLKEGEVLVGRDPVPVSDMTEKMMAMAESATVVMDRLKNGEGTVGKLLTEDKIYNDLEALTADLRAHPWKLFKRGRGKSDEEDEDVFEGAGNKGVLQTR